MTGGVDTEVEVLLHCHKYFLQRHHYLDAFNEHITIFKNITKVSQTCHHYGGRYQTHPLHTCWGYRGQQQIHLKIHLKMHLRFTSRYTSRYNSRCTSDSPQDTPQDTTQDTPQIHLRYTVTRFHVSQFQLRLIHSGPAQEYPYALLLIVIKLTLVHVEPLLVDSTFSLFFPDFQVLAYGS